jgi:hypothetical protein
MALALCAFAGRLAGVVRRSVIGKRQDLDGQPRASVGLAGIGHVDALEKATRVIDLGGRAPLTFTSRFD